MKRHYIIPIFVPHRGCPHDCIFCNQRRITGRRESTDERGIQGIIEKYLATFPPGTEIHKEIAFYGGSFTGIPLGEQKKLLEIARQYKARGLVDGIRISTRPDYISREILNFLHHQGVTVIELGVQSLDDEVLEKSRRGHTSRDVFAASRMIRQFSFQLGLQMMVGLPGDTREKVVATAQKIAGLQPDFVRIYPTVVLEGTLLAALYREGSYQPLSLAEAVDQAAMALLIFTGAGIPVIRVGLQPSEELYAKEGIIAGPAHPAFRELAESRIAYFMMCCLLNQLPAPPHRVEFLVHPRWLSAALGNKRANIINLSSEYGVDSMRICGHEAVDRGDIKLHAADNQTRELYLSKKTFAARVAGMFGSPHE